MYIYTSIHTHTYTHVQTYIHAYIHSMRPITLIEYDCLSELQKQHTLLADITPTAKNITETEQTQ